MLDLAPRRFVLFAPAVLLTFLTFAGSDAPADTTRPPLVRYGTMHEAIGQGQHHGRVALGDVTSRPNFFGIAALAGLAGEVTIVDGAVTVTGVDEDGRPRPGSSDAPQATLLAGAYVASWIEHPVERDIASGAFDDLVADAASAAGLNTAQPFVFTVEGDLTGLGYHVINGSCPRRARTDKDLPQAQRPYEGSLERVRGTLVGVFARDAAGELTHPDTTTHVHIVFADPESGETLTAHVDRVGVARGAVLRLPD